MRLLLLFAILTGSGAVGAREEAVYRWTDGAGEVHYTNEPQQIPQEFRKSAARTEGAELSEVRAVPEPTPPLKGGPEVLEAPPPPPMPSAEAARPQNHGPTEEEWRKAFQTQRRRVQAAQTELGQAQADGRQANSTASRERLQKARAEVAAAQGALRALEHDASLYGVPPNWRK